MKMDVKKRVGEHGLDSSGLEYGKWGDVNTVIGLWIPLHARNTLTS